MIIVLLCCPVSSPQKYSCLVFFAIPETCYKCLFRLLNLKNDGLRKKFDGIKYDLKKVEEVVYDLSIRGLNKAVEAEDKTAKKECETENIADAKEVAE